MKKKDTFLDGRNIAEVPARVLAGQLELMVVWERVHKKGGMPGVDGVSVSRFARDVQSNILRLQSALAGNVYQPLPLRMVEVAKKSGALRLLLVPAVADRIAQSAVARWLGSRWNPSFDPNSFAYRPGVGVANALRALAALRDEGFHWVLDADIRSFFDSIDHAILLRKLQRLLGETSPLLEWIHRWITAPIWDGAQLEIMTRGVPQGSPLSPLLSNYYLDGFDRRLRSSGMRFVRYADDFLVLSRTPFDLAEARTQVEDALRELNLTLNSEKTNTTTFEQWFRFLGAEIQGESIMLPFEKNKKRDTKVNIAPVMPAALLRAYKAGYLKTNRLFVWKERKLADVPGSTPFETRAKAPSSHEETLKKLSGGTNPLDILRRNLP